jgi:hypothetical protein
MSGTMEKIPESGSINKPLFGVEPFFFRIF